MWDELARWWRVEAALWVCYWNALDRKDQASVRRCADGVRNDCPVFAGRLPVIPVAFLNILTA